MPVKLKVGTRVTVYWPDDDAWYIGTVAALNEGDDDDEDYSDYDNRVLVKYDDGDTDWIDPTTTKLRISTKPHKFLKTNTLKKARNEERLAQQEIGSRISVWMPHEKEYYTGTLVEIDSDEEDRNPHHIYYDNGDEEWMNLLFRKWKQVHAKAMRLKVGSRVSILDKNDKSRRHYPGTLIEIIPEKPRPHRVEYDCKSRSIEWLNLNVHPFLDILEPQMDRNGNTGMKRKKEFMKDEHHKEKPWKKVKVEDETQIAECKENCGICGLQVKRPRAASCHHIFCKRCIENYERNSTCPLCEQDISLENLVKFDPDHPSYKSVEALNRVTAEVCQSFSSASEASMKSDFIASKIITACQSKRRDDREHRGYYWRFKGSKDRILRIGESVKTGIPIEQIDLKTSEIIETFPSSRKAHEKTGVSRCTIKRVLEKRGKADGGGFFWRFQGETHAPWPDPVPTNLNPVEQLDFETGDFLKAYKSLAEAKRAMGLRPNSGCIRDVCEGKDRASAFGFFWRWKGSEALPNHMRGVEKLVQIRKERDGKVVKEFRTSREAQAFFGHQQCWSTICRFCREKSYHLGYYWQYRILKESKRWEEKILGKRLRVQNPPGTSDWFEGKVDSFNPVTGKHTIHFDNNVLESYKLEDICYEWKNDQGQKPVEKLNLKTGKVLATFKSVSDAAAHLGPSQSASHITSVLHGRSKSSGGFFWRYKGSQLLPPKPKGSRKVKQLCLKTGKVIAIHNSITAAGKAVGITTPGISYCCNGRNGSTSAGGFGWKFLHSST